MAQVIQAGLPHGYINKEELGSGEDAIDQGGEIIGYVTIDGKPTPEIVDSDATRSNRYVARVLYVGATIRCAFTQGHSLQMATDEASRKYYATNTVYGRGDLIVHKITNPYDGGMHWFLTLTPTSQNPTV